MTDQVRQEILKIGVRSGLWTSRKRKITQKDIREFKDKVYWNYISRSQVLSEDFIREFKDQVDWNSISKYQVLSEDFIREFKDQVYWYYISQSQVLSEDFIREFKNKVYWNLPVWLYYSREEKEQYIRDHTSYQITDGKVIAFKSVRRNMASVFKPGLVYEVGKTYSAQCDCTETENSFGLSAWTKDGALGYHKDGRLLKVSIDLDDLGIIVHDGDKIRARRITIVDDVTES